MIGFKHPANQLLDIRYMSLESTTVPSNLLPTYIRLNRCLLIIKYNYALIKVNFLRIHFNTLSARHSQFDNQYSND